MKIEKLLCALLTCLLAPALFFCAVTASNGSVIHVGGPYSSDSNDGIGTGSGDWNHSKVSIQSAMNAAVSGDEIWVASIDIPPVSFGGDGITTGILKSGVKLLGGFSAVESSREQRDIVNNRTTILNMSNNPIYIPAGASSDTVLDGFTIELDLRGYISPVIIDQGSSAVISHNIIAACAAAMNNPTLNDVVISLSAGHQVIKDNVIYGGGVGVVTATGSKALIANNTFHCTVLRGNTKAGYREIGPGVYLGGSDVFVNNILNYSSPAYTTHNGDTISVASGASPRVWCNYYNLISGGTPSLYGNILGITPGLDVPETVAWTGFQAQLHLLYSSPCIGSGTTSILWQGANDLTAIPYDLTGTGAYGTNLPWLEGQNCNNNISGETDIDGQLRVETAANRGAPTGSGLMDMGADEYYAPPTGLTLSPSSGIAPLYVGVCCNPPTTGYNYTIVYYTAGITPPVSGYLLNAGTVGIPSAGTLSAQAYYRVRYNAGSIVVGSYTNP